MASFFVPLAPIVFVCLWATGFVGARLGMPYAEPASFLALRYAIAFVLLALFALAMGAKWPRGRDAFHTLVVGALVHGVYLGMVFWAVRNGMPGGVSAIIVGLQPLLSAILAGAWLKEPITHRHWGSLAIGMAGVLLVLGPGLDANDSGITPVTIAACLLAVIAIATGTIYQKRFATTTDLRTGTALQYIGALIPTLAFAFAFESFQITWNGQSLFALAWLVTVLSISAVFLLMWLIREGSVARVSSLFFLVPAVASLMTWYLFGETLVPLQLAGMVLCATAVALAARKSGTAAAKV
ncbi:DMT family transporter [Pseudahrensia aquimaris]|uniref:DMT family transporter n=1 Tax=Pseudahrensia aquimaris TaxID=744461 RepID=A0ABW3FEV7_9HYPH